MESFLPSEIGRLIYGYLTECDQDLADMFLNSSNVMEECRLSKNKSRRFSAKVQGLSLVDILDQYSILCSLILKNVSNTECVHRNVLSLLQNLLYSKVCQHDKSLADSLQRQDFDVETTLSQSNEHRHTSISEPVVDLVAENVPNSTNTVGIPQAETSGCHIVEHMDVSSSSAVNESQNVSKVVEQCIQTEPIESISLLESDNEAVINNKELSEFKERSPIDLTSPCPAPSIFDSPKAKDTVSCEDPSTLKKINSDVPSKPKPKVEKTKTPAPKAKSKLINDQSEPKSQENRQLSNEIITPPEIVKSSRIRDTSVFSTLSLNPNCRRDSYHTPLKPIEKCVFGENILCIDNNHKVQDSQPPVSNLRKIPSHENITQIEDKSALNDQNKSTESEKIVVKSHDTSKQTESAPKPVRKSISKPAEKRESSRTAPQIIPPHHEKPPSSKASSKLLTVTRESHTKYGNQSKDIAAQSSKPPWLEAPPNNFNHEGNQLKEPPFVDLIVNSKKKPEPWDANLRRLLASAEAESVPKEPSRKTPKKCKRELKSCEHPAKKRKLDNIQNPKAKRIKDKNHPDGKSENRQHELNVEHPPSNHRSNQHSKHQSVAQHDRGDQQASDVPLMPNIGPYSTYNLPKIEKTSEAQRVHKRIPKRPPPEAQRHSSPSLSKIKTTKSDRNSPVNQTTEVENLWNENYPEIHRPSQSIPVKESPLSERPSVTSEPPNRNEPGTENEPVLPVELANMISTIMRSATENAPLKSNLVIPEAINEQDADSGENIPLIALDTEDIELYKANINVDTPSC